MKKKIGKVLSLVLALVMVLSLLPMSAFTAYTTYTSHVTLYPGDGTPTGTNMKVGDHYNGNWYVEAISTSSVKFGSPYGEHNNNFRVPYPEEIWTGVSHNYTTKVTYCTAFSHDVNAGANGQIIYTAGKATYANVVNVSTTPDPTPTPAPAPTPRGPGRLYTTDAAAA